MVLSDLIERNAAFTPDKRATVFEGDFLNYSAFSARIEQTIYVERDGQRAIVLGKGGEVIKWIGKASRVELEDILDRKIHLFLHVKVKENWAEERGLFNDMGLDFDV